MESPKPSLLCEEGSTSPAQFCGTEEQLHEPSNVKVESRNFSLFLTWLPASKNSLLVTYKVQHTIDVTDPTGWASVPACENISITECNFTCVLTKFLYHNQSIRVQTVSPLPNSSSTWVEIPNITYMFTVDPDPPYLTVTKGKDAITIDSSTQMPNCIPPIFYTMMVKYYVEIRRRDNPEEVVYEGEQSKFPVTVQTPGYKGEYCVAAKTIYISNPTKESKFSHPICLDFTEKDGHLHMAYLAAPPICIIVFIYLIIWHKVTVKAKKPKALDFPKNKYCQKDSCFPDMYSEIYHSLTIYNITEQDSSAKHLPPNKYDDGVNIYPVSGQGYMERRTMQTSGSHSQGYFSSKGLACNSSSDQSATSCTSPNTSGSVTDMLFQAKNDQTNNCPKEINISVLEDGKMLSSTSKSVRNSLDSLSPMEPNSLVNVPLNTLCIGGIIDMDNCMDNSDGESSNHCFTDSEDGLDSLSTDFKTSEYPSQYKIPHKDCCSDYTQRTYMSRR
ncbi:interferon lambda receptor 1 isoform X2 [Hyla sarda]|uniref:interferon lambda receptor 1 isoform X2 n=1 Tax=Hyla sarda TaxID=327740 RepID=UPI0024C44A85|nr:interferon lambda receptor 1 isoform X2 [Hyla sarda]